VAKSKRTPPRSSTPSAVPALQPTDPLESSGSEPSKPLTSPSLSSEAILPSLPSTWLRWTLAAFLPIHFGLIGTSYLSSIAPSSVQARLVEFARPYLAALHLEADGVSLNLATSAAKEKTHVLEQAVDLRPDVESWSALPTTGFAGGDRQRRWQRYLAGVSELGDNEQSAIAAWLVEPLAERYVDAKYLRITRVPDLMTTVVDDNAAAPYTAAVLREADSPVRVVLVPAQRLASPSVSTPGVGETNE
jgi:hypothetical protein